MNPTALPPLPSASSNLASKSSSRISPLFKVAQRALCTSLTSMAILGALGTNSALAYDSQPQMASLAASAQAQYLSSELNLHITAKHLIALQKDSAKLDQLESIESVLIEQKLSKPSNSEQSPELINIGKKVHTLGTKLRQSASEFTSIASKDVDSYARALISKGFYSKIPSTLQVHVRMGQPAQGTPILNAFATTDFNNLEAPRLDFEFPYAAFLFSSKSSIAMDSQQADVQFALAKQQGHQFSLPNANARLDQQPQSQLAPQVLLEMTTLHELAHIEHAYRPFVFEHPQLSTTANAAISHQLRKDFKSGNETPGTPVTQMDNVDSIHGLLLENYADTHMALSYLKLHGSTPQTIQNLQLFAASRAHNSAMYTLEHGASKPTFTGFIEGYRTHDALEFIIKNATVLEKMPLQNISQAASFVAASFTHALTSDLVTHASKSLDQMTPGAKLLNAKTIEHFSQNRSAMQCSECGVNTQALLQYALFPDSALSMNTTPPSLTAKRSAFAQNKHSTTSYQPVQMPVTQLPTFKTLGM